MGGEVPPATAPATGRGPAQMRAAAHVFVEDLEDPDPDATDRHHLVRSLRLRPGEVVTVSDGRGRWRPCRYLGERRGALLEPDGPVVADEAPPPRIGVAFALTQGVRPERVVQRCTEAGADRIVPISTRRSLVRWEPAQVATRAARLRRVAREAAMQSRRSQLPEVGELTELSALVASPPIGATGVMAERGGPPPSLERSFVLVGPEGGWDPGELSAGLPVVGLGPTVMRTETAAVAATILFSALRWGVVSRPSVRRQ